MADQRAISQRAVEIVRETGTTLDYAYELAAAELDPDYSDCGPGMPDDQVQDFVRSLVRGRPAALPAD